MKSISLFIMFITLVSSVSAQDQKTIELVLDSSGSMNAKLPDGKKRIDAAKEAIEKVIADLPQDTILAFRAYGHQSSTFKRDCNDTALLVPFGKLSDVKSTVMDHLQRLEPRGFTPITKALQLAAADFKKDSSASSRTIILVSDGQESCEGDPCVAARELQRSGINLAVHTIGLGVDFATRSQLSCISRATGGSYFDAENTTDLLSVLNQAVKKEVTQVQVDKGTGFLEIPKVTNRIHEVIDAATGKEVAKILLTQRKVELPAGVYHVTFDKDVWKSIEVKPGETTVLNPGKLIIKKNSVHPSHKVVHTETGKEHGVLAIGSESILLVPGDYDVTFKKIVWPSIRVDADKDTIINPGAVQVIGGKVRDHCKVYGSDGSLVETLGSGMWSFDLPPGEYTIEIAGKKQPFTIEEGKVVEFSLK